MNYRIWIVALVGWTVSWAERQSEAAVETQGETQATAGALATAEGQLAHGLEVINGNLETLATQANDYAQITDKQVDAAASLTAEATSILVNSEIVQLQDQLRETQAKGEELRARLADSSLVCQRMATCGECAGNDACVWCSAEKKCVAGDRNGPLGGECSAYSYSNCGGGCSEHSQCAACLADSRCGWCLNGGVCMPGSATDPSTCNPSYWLFQSTQYGNLCPGTPGVTATYVPEEKNVYVDTQLSRLQRELRITTQREALIRQQLDMLQGELEAIIVGFSAADAGTVQDVSYENQLDGLATVVDTTSAASYSDLLKRTTAVATEVGTAVSKDTIDAVQASNSDRIEKEEEFLTVIKGAAEDLASDTAKKRDEIEKQKEANVKLQEEQQKLQKDAASQGTTQPAAFLQVYSSFLRE